MNICSLFKKEPAIPCGKASIGLNFNSIIGNSTLPRGCIFASEGNLLAGLEDITSIGIHTDVRELRSLLWVCERDSMETPWLHIPPTEDEIERIGRYLKESDIPIELSWGPLWEAQWLWSEQGVDTRDNPYQDVNELFAAYKQSLGGILPCLRESTTFDIHNEFNLVKTNWVPIMELWYPYALNVLRSKGIMCTVSVVLPEDGNTEWARNVYRWLKVHGGLPDWMELHINGWSNANLKLLLPRSVDSLVKEFRLPITFGEVDVALDSHGWYGIMACGPEEVILWR